MSAIAALSHGCQFLFTHLNQKDPLLRVGSVGDSVNALCLVFKTNHIKGNVQGLIIADKTTKGLVGLKSVVRVVEAVLATEVHTVS